MLTISRQADYASRIILHLTLQPRGSRITEGEIAKQRLIPRSFVRRVVTQLSAAGLLTTTRGSDGGITLARPADEISLLEVVEAIDGPLMLNICTEDPQFCPLMPACTVHEAWVDARHLLTTQLTQVTFDKLAARHNSVAAQSTMMEAHTASNE